MPGRKVAGNCIIETNKAANDSANAAANFKPNPSIIVPAIMATATNDPGNQSWLSKRLARNLALPSNKIQSTAYRMLNAAAKPAKP